MIDLTVENQHDVFCIWNKEHWAQHRLYWSWHHTIGTEGLNPVRQVRWKPIHYRLSNTKTPIKDTQQCGVVETVSNAELKSSRTRAVTSLLSTARMRSLYMHSIAVLVEWPRRYEDCLVGNKWLSSACRTNLDAAVRSTTFEVKEIFEIGL